MRFMIRPGRFRNFPSVSGLSVFVLQTLITPIGGRLGVFSFGYRVTELRLTVPAQVYKQNTAVSRRQLNIWFGRQIKQVYLHSFN